MIIVYPLSNNYSLVDENYIEYDSFINQELYYSMIIIDNNSKYLKWKINQIIIIIFFLIGAILIIFIFFIFVKIFFEFHFNPINKILQIIKGASLKTQKFF